MTQNRQLRVFLCYASQDKSTVRELHQRLKTESWIDSWLDEDRLLLGEDWDMKIQRELESADIVIVFISDAAIKKTGYVQKELRLIYDISLYKPEDTIFVIPLRLEECQPPLRFRLWQWGDYFGEKKETTYQNLIQSLKKRYEQKLPLEVKERVQPETGIVSRKAKEKKIILNIKQHIRKEDLFLQKISHLHVRDRQLPLLSILLVDQNTPPDERMINRTAGMIEKTLADFRISVIVIGFRSGPRVIQFAVQPSSRRRDEKDAQQLTEIGPKIVSLQNDLALALSIAHVRIEAPVPGRPYIGIEIPNPRNTIVRLRSILESDVFHKIGSSLAIALGRDVSNRPVVMDLARIPHLLIAGATGSGKSVCITAIAACLAMNNSPEDLCMVMMDPRMGELSQFNGLPHLYWNVETNIKRILGILRWLVIEMENRYRLLESAHVNNIEAYNRHIASTSRIPHVVVLIDEVADLMMSAPDLTKDSLVRLVRRAHIAGIHLIVTTQSPSIDVLTSSIRANFPARLSFTVMSSVDSRVILDMTGAEGLLGQGDMLFRDPDLPNPVRAQGVMITALEIERLIAHWQKAVDVSIDLPLWEQILTESEKNQDEELIEKAISIVHQSHRASASLLQRRLRIGYPRAARLLDQLGQMGVIGPSQGGGKERDVLSSPVETDSPKLKGENIN